MRKAASFTTVILSFVIALFAGSSGAQAQSLVHDRIARSISDSSVAAIPGTANPLARAEYDTGRVNASAPYTGMTMYFRPSVQQQVALDALVQAQRTPGSAFYHHWITPAQYASQFGLSSNDLAAAQAWLEQNGFTVLRTNNSRTAIVFSGTAAQVESAFHTELHHYTVRGVTHTANSTALSLPTALAGVVMSIRGLSDFRPHALHRFAPTSAAKSHYTSSSGDHYLAPADFATIYDLNPLYNAGYTGSGITIVVVGQTEIVASDITAFQSAAGLTQKAPTTTLVTGSGTAAQNDADDEVESDLDLEWSGAVAKSATINFVYTGNNQNYGVFDSIQYAIDNNLGPIISNSYGACEADLSTSDVTTFESMFEQANTQGQTVVSAAGDDGATDCETTASNGNKGTVVDGDEATQGLAVDYPGTSPYVTSIGGTEFSADTTAAGTYWNSSNATGGGSAIEYIPEMVWNDTSTQLGPDAGGGGKSILFGKPSWQTGTGVPSDGARDVPDVSLNASPQHDGYLFCSSSSDASGSGCSGGFSGAGVAGGTSFGAPTFSGILAILSQKLDVTGLGNINPEIYSLAATDYASAFHDTTIGSNEIPCEIGSTGCTTSPIGYAAATGYDLASGWGSIDAGNFVDAYTTTTSTTPAAVATTTALTASPTTATAGTAITLTATVSPNTGTTTPSGTVQFTVGGTAQGSAVTLSSGVATTTYTPATAGSLTIVAAFTPTDSTAFSASSATLFVTVTAVTGSYTLTATNVTVAQGSSAASTVTVAPVSGFTGAVSLTATGPTTLTNSCFTYTNPTNAATGAINIFTSESSCVTAGLRRTTTADLAPTSGTTPAATLLRALSGTALLSMLFLGFPARHRRRWPSFLALFALASLTFAVTGCGSSGTSTTTTTSTTAAKGTYTITVTGTNATDNLSATTTFTLTVD